MRVIVQGLAGLLIAMPVAAQDIALGRIEYMANCAQCHGVAGKGDGVIASYMTPAPSDLTALARRTGGTFLADQVYATIEAGRRSGPHGTRDMPAWGDRYSVDAAQAYGFTYTPEEQVAFIHRRITALVAYVATLQEP